MGAYSFLCATHDIMGAYSFLCATHDIMGAYSFLVYLFVCPTSLCEFNSSDVIGLIAFIFYMMIGHDV
jgi:hypothetical protein